MTAILAAAGIAVPLVAGGQTAARDEAWRALAFFEGRWEGTGTGQPGTGTLAREYTFTLNSRFLVASNVVTYAPQPKNPKGERHEDVGYFSFDGGRGRIVLRQFHVEGFINQYVAGPIAPGTKTFVFVSEAIENIPDGWRARETLAVTGPDAFEEVFELAAPGKDFEVYSRTALRRAK